MVNPPSLMDELLKIEETIKSRLAHIAEHAPVESLLEKPALELALMFLEDVKNKLEKGEVSTEDEMERVKGAIELAEMGAQINMRVVMDDAHS